MALRRFARLLALGLAAAVSPPAAASEIGALQARATAGDPQAAFRLGVLAELGHGAPRDEAAAFRWYTQAASAGLPDAEFNVAAMLEAGNGTRADAAAAARWYARAAVHGVARAAYDLGQMYAAGQGVPLNLALAERWLEASRLPAARDLLAELRDHPPAAPPLADAALLPPAPQAAGRGDRNVLVWNAPAEPVPVRYYVSIARLGPTGPAEAANLLTDRSAVPVNLPDQAARYAWRVFAVGAGGHYAASAWQAL